MKRANAIIFLTTKSIYTCEKYPHKLLFIEYYLKIKISNFLQYCNIAFELEVLHANKHFSESNSDPHANIDQNKRKNKKIFLTLF